ncbi:MAG TPA: glycerol-3-phosphate dehydrogenase/oxidase [Chitinophagaceae bacterium]|nr:glycerol-3-phosphate dehydrogenase/oxidase [Chitinophagaceae bacterium]
MKREDVIAKINEEIIWDVLVIGGGATGLGIALEACTRGYSTLLVEQSDFAKSTSSKSTKLVHGGVRYLAQGNVKLVREASVERGLLYKNAPHLVKNLRFIIPVYTRWNRLKYTIGLKLYDWISGSLSLGSSVFIGRKEVIKNLPTINSKKLRGGVLYHDGQFDDARLAINIAQSIFDNGGFAINYMQVKSMLREKEKVCAAIIADKESSKEFIIKAKAIVNATGIFVDDIIRMDDPKAQKSIAVSQGAHIVLDKKFLQSDDAIMIPKTSDGRVLFIVPWHGKLIAGTTDTPVQSASLEPIALEKEIQFILQTATSYLTLKPSRKDVLSIFAGLRPLAAPKEKGNDTKEISRSHKIIVSPSKLFTIIGGKWTTYRKMGEEMIDKIENELHWNSTASITSSLHIHGYSNTTHIQDPLYFYGSDKAPLKNLIAKTGDVWISDMLCIHKAQVIWAIREEMAMTVEDILSRRTRAILLDAKESLHIASVVAEIMAEEMNKDQIWIEEQVKAFSKVAKNYVINEA